MESENKPNLNSILENAREQLEMYRRTSQEDVREMTREMLLSRTKEQEIEDTSGPLFDQNKDQASCAVSEDRTKDDVCKIARDSSKDSKEASSRSAVDEEGMEEEESSNKNFDSSTISLGEQQSFQNQTELTSQTTYTNIHELTGPVKDDILVITGPTSESTSDNQSTPSQQFNVQDDSSGTTTNTNMTTESTDHKTDDLPPNQMAMNMKLEPKDQTKEETVISEVSPQTQDEDVDKGDICLLAGAGTREGSPVRIDPVVINQVADKLSELTLVDEGNQGECERVSECMCTKNYNDDALNNDEVKAGGVCIVTTIFDSQLIPQSVIEVVENVSSQNQLVRDSRQIEFVEHFDSRMERSMNNQINFDNISDGFEDEGFVDSKDLLQPTKIIFVSEQEEEKSSKPFETEDDNSCSIENSTIGEPELQPTLSLTNIRSKMDQDETGEINEKTVEASSNLDNKNSPVQVVETKDPPLSVIDVDVEKNQNDSSEHQPSLPEILENILLLKLSDVLRPNEITKPLSDSTANPPLILTLSANTPSLPSGGQVADTKEAEAINAPKIVAVQAKITEKSQDSQITEDTISSDNMKVSPLTFNDAAEQPNIPTAPESSVTSNISIVYTENKLDRSPRQYALNRPSTPYVSESTFTTSRVNDRSSSPQFSDHHPNMNINEVLQPQNLHTSFEDQVQDGPVHSTKSPPRPPPRLRQKKPKFNFIRKLFGLKDTRPIS